MAKPVISFEEFDKTELKVGTVLAAEGVESSNKLVKLSVDLGGEKRQIIAGIRKSYQPEQLLGMQIVVIANLAPRSLAGLESQGMVLAAHDEAGLPIVLRPERSAPNGSDIS